MPILLEMEEAAKLGSCPKRYISNKIHSKSNTHRWGVVLVENTHRVSTGGKTVTQTLRPILLEESQKHHWEKDRFNRTAMLFKWIKLCQECKMTVAI